MIVCGCVLSRYDHLEAKTKAQSEIQQGSIDQLEEYNSRIRDLRRALQVGGIL
jgi:glycine cleavage system pyridoxal-binding protein P